MNCKDLKKLFVTFCSLEAFYSGRLIFTTANRFSTFKSLYFQDASLKKLSLNEYKNLT